MFNQSTIPYYGSCAGDPTGKCSEWMTELGFIFLIIFITIFFIVGIMTVLKKGVKRIFLYYKRKSNS